MQIMSFRCQNRVKTKKKSSPKIEEFLSPKSSENQKKSSPQFGTKFSPNLLDSCGLTGPFSSDQPALKSRWGTLNLDGGTLNFDGKMLTIDGNALPCTPPTI